MCDGLSRLQYCPAPVAITAEAGAKAEAGLGSGQGAKEVRDGVE